MKSKIIGKKHLLTASLVIALCLAVFVNWYYTNQNSEITKPDVTQKHNLGEAQLVNSNTLIDNNDYFSQAKLSRTKAHDESKKHLEKIISDSDMDKETVELARSQLVKISQHIKLENDMENLIKAQTKNECLVTYSDEGVEIVLPKEIVNDKNVILVKNIVVSKTNLSSENIVIIEL